jgi:hypothetical protein
MTKFTLADFPFSFSWLVKAFLQTSFSQTFIGEHFGIDAACYC